MEAVVEDIIGTQDSLWNSEVVSLQEHTAAWVWRAFYAKYWFIAEITSILTGKKTNPWELLDAVESTRTRFKAFNILDKSQEE